MDEVVLDSHEIINISMQASEWEIAEQWLSRMPFDEAVALHQKIAKEIKEAQEEEPESPVVTLRLEIRECDKVLFSLALAPYYLVADFINSIYNQGMTEMNRLKAEKRVKGNTDESKSE